MHKRYLTGEHYTITMWDTSRQQIKWKGKSSWEPTEVGYLVPEEASNPRNFKFKVKRPVFSTFRLLHPFNLTFVSISFSPPS